MLDEREKPAAKSDTTEIPMPIMKQIGEGIIPLSPETRYQAIVVSRLATARAMLHAAEYWIREGNNYPSLTRICGNLMEADELICSAYCELLGVDAGFDSEDSRQLSLPTSSGA